MLRACFSRFPAVKQMVGGRGLSTAADQSVRLPATVYGLSGRYANALYVSAVKAKGLDGVVTELAAFQKSIESDPKLKMFVLDPTVPRKVKTETMISMFKNGSETTRKFFGVLCDNGRMSEIENVLKDFNTLMSAHRKEINATVTTVVPLEPAEIAAVKDALLGFVAPGHTLNLTTAQDPTILGGMLVVVGDRSIDLTMIRTLTELQMELESPITVSQ